MNKKNLVISFIVGTILLSGILFFENKKINSPNFVENNPAIEPVTITHNSSIELLTIDEKIERSEIVVVGLVMNVLPSQWLAPNGKELKNATPEEIFQSGGLFTDSLISVEQMLKGNYDKPVVRVRSFVGETEKVRWVDSGQPTYKSESLYLFFLKKDTGPSASVNPGDYMSVNSDTAIYEIINGKAISADDEWVLEELIAYIQKSLVSDMPLSILSPVPTESLTELPTETPAP